MDDLLPNLAEMLAKPGDVILVQGDLWFAWRLTSVLRRRYGFKVKLLVHQGEKLGRAAERIDDACSSGLYRNVIFVDVDSRPDLGLLVGLANVPLETKDRFNAAHCMPLRITDVKVENGDLELVVSVKNQKK